MVCVEYRTAGFVCADLIFALLNDRKNKNFVFLIKEHSIFNQYAKANKTGCTVLLTQSMHIHVHVHTDKIHVLYIMKKHAHKLHNLLKLTI